MRNAFCLLLIVICVIGCADRARNKRVTKRLLTNYSEAQLKKYAGESFKAYFASKKSGGQTLDAYIASLNEWDFPLHGRFDILELHAAADSATAIVNEQNDFSKGIGYPGWKATIILHFDDNHRITEQIYFPYADNADYRAWLKPALEWLIINRAETVSQIFNIERSRLIKSPQSAKMWVKLLNEWKSETNQRKR